MCALQTAALGAKALRFFASPSSSPPPLASLVSPTRGDTSAPVISPARRTASSAGHAPAATPRASTVSTEDAAWLLRLYALRNAGSETKRSYVASAQRTFSALWTSSAAAAASAAPNVRSVGSTRGRARSISASAAFAAGRSRARAAAVITELYVRALGEHRAAGPAARARVHEGVVHADVAGVAQVRDGVRQQRARGG